MTGALQWLPMTPFALGWYFYVCSIWRRDARRLAWAWFAVADWAWFGYEVWVHATGWAHLGRVQRRRRDMAVVEQPPQRPMEAGRENAGGEVEGAGHSPGAQSQTGGAAAAAAPGAESRMSRRAAQVSRRRIDMAAGPAASPRVGNLMDDADHVLHIPPADYTRDRWWAAWAVQRHARDVLDPDLLADVTGLGGI